MLGEFPQPRAQAALLAGNPTPKRGGASAGGGVISGLLPGLA